MRRRSRIPCRSHRFGSGVAHARLRRSRRCPSGRDVRSGSEITRAVTVPVTVDAESGYRLKPAALAGKLLDIGAAGCNFEDTDHETGSLRDPRHQADLLAALRGAAGQSLVINARVDVFLNADNESDVLDAGHRACPALPRGRSGLRLSHPRTRSGCYWCFYPGRRARFRQHPAHRWRPGHRGDRRPGCRANIHGPAAMERTTAIPEPATAGSANHII